MQTHEIRERFTNHFVRAGHEDVPSASLILDDPNLLFVNAGMVPFKPYFLGQQNPPFPNGLATSIQKCVRTLDIEEVGITTRHNTFFQMAGNFSFGQYFKEGAIKHAWELLTNPVEAGGYGFDPEKLWVTVYLDDDEAADIWENVIGLPPERIQRLGMADNYWSMGIPGPCGPCSEIYYDRGPAYGKEGGPIVDDSRYLEIWNLVFMENERGEGIGKDNFEILGPLPKKNIDTGMGIERVACLLQGVDNVYETDLLRPVIDVAENLTGCRYGTTHESDIRFRVIADHSRTAMMLILDGVTPGNEGRGYILRRLLRRIIRSARLLGATGKTMEKFMNTIMDTMTPSYPEIAKNRERILRVATTEEAAFLKTLESGTQLFEEATQKIKATGGSLVAGADAFALHDTYGFPIDLTLEMAAEAGLEVDTAGFDALMAEQRARAKADSQAKKHGHTDLSSYRQWVDNHPTEFIGYDELSANSTVIGLLHDGATVNEVATGQEVEVILDASTFYAESGGQIGDRGQLVMGDTLLTVNDVQKIGKKLWVHRATVETGGLNVGDVVTAAVDPTWRHAARQAHSATHLIHAALREVLGPTAVQAGSMNKPGYLRFDFNYTEALTPKQLQQIEEITNQAVDSDWVVNTIETTLEEAKAMGAMALFGGFLPRKALVGGKKTLFRLDKPAHVKPRMPECTREKNAENHALQPDKQHIGNRYGNAGGKNTGNQAGEENHRGYGSNCRDITGQHIGGILQNDGGQQQLGEHARHALGGCERIGKPAQPRERIKQPGKNIEDRRVLRKQQTGQADGHNRGQNRRRHADTGEKMLPQNQQGAAGLARHIHAALQGEAETLAAAHQVILHAACVTDPRERRQARGNGGNRERDDKTAPKEKEP